MDHDGGFLRESGKPEGRYANYFKVGHNAFEFVIDCGQYYAATQAAEFYIRIVTTPAYAKNLLEILEESVQQYERAHGKIEEG